jgi:hypothetical protein
MFKFPTDVWTKEVCRKQDLVNFLMTTQRSTSWNWHMTQYSSQQRTEYKSEVLWDQQCLLLAPIAIHHCYQSPLDASEIRYKTTPKKKQHERGRGGGFRREGGFSSLTSPTRGEQTLEAQQILRRYSITKMKYTGSPPAPNFRSSASNRKLIHQALNCVHYSCSTVYPAGVAQ